MHANHAKQNYSNMGIYVEESRENPDTKYHINIIGKVNAIETQKAKLVTEVC